MLVDTFVRWCLNQLEGVVNGCVRQCVDKFLRECVLVEIVDVLDSSLSLRGCVFVRGCVRQYVC